MIVPPIDGRLSAITGTELSKPLGNSLKICSNRETITPRALHIHHYHPADILGVRRSSLQGPSPNQHHISRKHKNYNRDTNQKDGYKKISEKKKKNTKEKIRQRQKIIDKTRQYEASLSSLSNDDTI